MTYYCDHKRHLVCVPYSIENLHQMADSLGIAREWYHGGDKPHYDIPKKRILEVQSKCVVVSPRVILKIIKGWNVGTVEEFLNLTSEEMVKIENKLK